MRAAANTDPLRDDDMAGLWLISLTVATMAVERFDVAERVVEQALAVAHERGSANHFALALNFRALVRHSAGDLRGAEADAHSALASEGLKGVMGYQSLIPLVDLEEAHNRLGLVTTPGAPTAPSAVRCASAACSPAAWRG